MIDSIFRPEWLFAAATSSTEAAEPATVTVVAIGLSLVFAILILLTLVLMIEGKIFAGLDKRKAEKAAKPVEQPPAAPAQPVAPVAAQGVPPEVIAAITAAVANIEGGKYALRAVSATPKGRGQWGLAGVISYTEPF